MGTHSEETVNLKKRRIVVDSTAIAGASSTHNFRAMLPTELEQVSRVDVVEALVRPELIQGTITFTVNYVASPPAAPVPADYVLTVPAGAYDDSFSSLSAKVLQLIYDLNMSSQGTNVYDQETGVLRFFVGGSDFTSVRVVVSNQALADAIGWPLDKTYTPPGGEVSPGLSVTIAPLDTTDVTFHPINWPRMHPVAYVQVAQLRTESQGGAGTTEVTNSEYTEQAIASVSGADGALVHVMPKKADDAWAHCTHVVEYPTPISRLNKLDVRVLRGDGTPYETPRCLMVLDVWCSRR